MAVTCSGATRQLPGSRLAAAVPQTRHRSHSATFTQLLARPQPPQVWPQPQLPSPKRRPLHPCRSSPEGDQCASRQQPPDVAASGGSAGMRAATAITNISGGNTDDALSVDRRRGLDALAALRECALAPRTVNVYGKPLTKSELSAFEAAFTSISADPRAIQAAAAGSSALKAHLRALLLDAAVSKSTPLSEVEGAMVALEHLARSPDAVDENDDPVLVQRRRWQLVVGADVGAVQYIPAVEELQVAPDGSSFTLGTDLDFLFTGFRGRCEWLAPGHLSYTVRQVRVEIRWPKAWRRAAGWMAWQRRQRPEARPRSRSIRADEPNWGGSQPGSSTCHEDPQAPAVLLPLPFFPTNELLTYSCDGLIAATRSRLTGGLILLLEVRTRDRLREQLRAGDGAEARGGSNPGDRAAA